ncbi:MAG: hypothetical protein H7Y88_03790 [Phycisphaerales bacterium]|nr:hypothetical protein [Phycisphaerales bacterium]
MRTIDKPRPLHMLRVLTALVLASLAHPAGAAARVDPPIPPPPPPNEGYVTTLVNNRIAMTDTVTGRAVLTPNLSGVLADCAANTTFQVTQQPGGFDLAVTYTNNTSQQQELGRIIVGGWRFPQQLNVWDLRHDSKVFVDDHGGHDYTSVNFTYPMDLYSPVLVCGDAEHTVGVSLLYPVMEWDHTIKLTLRSPYRRPGDQGRNWEIEARLLGQIPAGETRTYTLTFRMARTGEHWLRTLVTYQSFFQNLYGGVQYERDPRPVQAMFIAEIGNLSPTNPRGFCQPTRRPDIHGWAPWAAHISTLPASGYNRVMLWAPSGLYRNNQNMNYPFNFLTPLNAFPAAANSWDELAAQSRPDLELGLYWGYPQRIMRTWDTSTSEVLDPDNSEHVALAFAELDQAVAAGAQMIGLDAYTAMGPADAWRWLNIMREHAPDTRFMLEVSPCDIFHNVAASWVFANELQTAHVLADFLHPGHETWAAIMFNVLANRLGHRPSPAEKAAEVRRVAALGYTPLIFDSIPLTSDMSAAEHWTLSVPPQYRLALGMNQNFNPGEVQPQLDGTNTLTSAWFPDRADGEPVRTLEGALAPGGGNAASAPAADTAVVMKMIAGFVPTRTAELPPPARHLVEKLAAAESESLAARHAAPGQTGAGATTAKAPKVSVPRTNTMRISTALPTRKLPAIMTDRPNGGAVVRNRVGVISDPNHPNRRKEQFVFDPTKVLAALSRVKRDSKTQITVEPGTSGEK